MEPNETQGQRITRSNASQQGEATMANEEQRKPGRPKKIRKPGRPKKIIPKPRIRVPNSPKGKRGRPPKPKLVIETELAEEMCLTLQDSMERRGTTASSAADADLDSRDEAIKERDFLMKQIGILRGELQQVREDYEHRLKENIRCTDALEETCSSQRHKISVLERELDDANQKHKDAWEARIALEKDREQKIKKIMELEAKVKQAESLAVERAESMQRFTLKCLDAANEADAMIGSVQVALGDAWNGDLKSWRI